MNISKPLSQITLSIVVPCYNEAKNIPLVLKRFDEVINRPDIEIILVDNGSTDNSESILAELLPRYRFARTVKVPVNQGYGFGILAGLKTAKGRFLGWTHADMQTDPADVIRALDIIDNLNKPYNLFIKGKRLNRSRFDSLFTTGMSIFESLLLQVRLSDINSQPTVFSHAFFESWKNPPHDFSLDLYAYALAKRRRMKIVRLPVYFPQRIHGTSSWNTGLAAKWKLIKRTLGFSWELKKEIRRTPNGFTIFIAHRINTVDELKKLPAYLGVEIDLRDRDNGKIIMEHEPFNKGEDFEEYLKHYNHGTMIINIKSERIEPRVVELLKKYDIGDYFFLDSSFPMVIALSKEEEKNIAVRFSEFESLDSVLAVKDRVRWVWVDCFSKFPLDRETYDQLKGAGLKLCLVSPELQGRDRDIEQYKELMKMEGIVFDAICTKSYNIERWL